MDHREVVCPACLAVARQTVCSGASWQTTWRIRSMQGDCAWQQQRRRWGGNRDRTKDASDASGRQTEESCLFREGKLPSQVWTAPPSKRSIEGCKKFQERRRETRRPTNDACDFIWQLSKRTPKYTHNAIAGKKRLGDKRSRDQVTISLIPWYTPSGPFPLTDILLTVYLTSTRQYPEVVPSLALSAPLKLQSVSFRSNPPTC